MRPIPAAEKSSSVVQPTRRDATCSTAEQTTVGARERLVSSRSAAVAGGADALSLPRPIVKVRP